MMSTPPCSRARRTICSRAPFPCAGGPCRPRPKYGPRGDLPVSALPRHIKLRVQRAFAEGVRPAAEGKFSLHDSIFRRFSKPSQSLFLAACRPSRAPPQRIRPRDRASCRLWISSGYCRTGALPAFIFLHGYLGFPLKRRVRLRHETRRAHRNPDSLLLFGLFSFQAFSTRNARSAMPITSSSVSVGSPSMK